MSSGIKVEVNEKLILGRRSIGWAVGSLVGLYSWTGASEARTSGGAQRERQR